MLPIRNLILKSKLILINGCSTLSRKPYPKEYKPEAMQTLKIPGIALRSCEYENQSAF